MNYRSHSLKERPRNRNNSIGRMFTTLFALCLPVVAAALFSGSFFKLATLQPGEVLNVTSAHAAGHSSSGHSGGHGSIQTTGTVQSTETAQATGTVQPTGTAQSTMTAQTTGTPGGTCSITGQAAISFTGSFNPSSINVAAGTSVTWTNNTANRIRVRDAAHVLFDSGDLYQGQSFTYTFCFGGSYPYEDARGSATGVVNVAGTPGPTGTGTVQSTTTAQPSGTAQTTVTALPSTTPGGNLVVVYAMRHDVFSPNDITISTGTTVRWTNIDDEDHTSTSDDGVWNSGTLAQGQSYDFTFLNPGEYPYTCLIHGVEMSGIVRVTGNPISPTPGTPTASPTIGGGTLDVDIQNFAFSPRDVTVLVGSTVRWTNRDSAPHTSTSDTGVWDGGTLNQNQTFSYTFNQVGDFAYACGYHSGMRGTVHVVASIPTGTATMQTTVTTQPTGTAQASTTAQTTTTAQPSVTATQPALVDIAIQNYAYSVITQTVQAGATVRWTNNDVDPHSVTSYDGLFDSGVFNQGQQWQYTFNTPGTYAYYCTVHGQFMTGYIVVQPAGACNIAFTDVEPGSTFYDYVRCLACRNVLGGYSDGTFKPNNGVTRGQLSKIVANAAGFDDTPAGQMFEDVAPGSTFYDFVQRIANRGIIGGYACGGAGEPCGAGNLPYFRPNAPATRGQIAKIVAEAKGLNNPASGQTFEDVAPGSTFYIYVERLAAQNTMSGYPCGGAGEPCGADNLPYFRPNNPATRGQVAKIVSNTFFPNCQP